jgi:hypothetical protein
VSASGQNVFFEELLTALRRELEAVGVQTETTEDHFPPARDDVVYIFVPHEYLPLTEPAAHPSAAQLRRSIAITTEQPGTAWFEEAAAVAAHTAQVLDINRLGVAELRRRGIAAKLLQLGYVTEWDAWKQTDGPRPIDATFLGSYTPRRGWMLSRCGSVLQSKRAAIHLVEIGLPFTRDNPFFLHGERKHRHLAASKVMLNAHQSENAYLEWQRLIEAAANGCVFLTEHSAGFEPLEPGEHFVSVSLENIPQALALLLDDRERLERIRDAAYELLRDELPLSRSIGVLAEAVENANRAPVETAPQARAPVPRPKRLPLPPYPWVVTPSDPVRRVLKEVLVTQRRLERRLDELADPAGRPRVEVRAFGPYTNTSPEISVVLTVYDYEDTVATAIRSAALSVDVCLELVVVDDASSDGSKGVVERTLKALPWLPAKLLARSRNGGLSSSRNLGIAHARADYVFILDADNSVYPHGLARLRDALREEPTAAFAYGTIEKFDQSGPIDLVSFLPWSVERFRYGNYIDAMALIKRCALEEVGGFSVELGERMYGWEDFALWCAFAEAGMRGVHVPEIVARYRASLGSMINSTRIDESDAWDALLESFPFLHGEAVTSA